MTSWYFLRSKDGTSGRWFGKSKWLSQSQKWLQRWIPPKSTKKMFRQHIRSQRVKRKVQTTCWQMDVCCLAQSGPKNKAEQIWTNGQFCQKNAVRCPSRMCAKMVKKNMAEMYVGLKKELTEIPRPLRPLQLIDWEAGRRAKTTSENSHSWSNINKQTADLLPMPKKQVDRCKQTADVK